jgi:molybdate transport system substrate-binding protein
MPDMLSRGRRVLTLLGLVSAIALAAGCGSNDNASDKQGELVVSAAASLKRAFTAYGEQFNRATVRFSFAGSDELAAQIRKGAKPDLFVSANTKLPDQLFGEGKVDKPTVFATNRLVLAVPKDSAVRSIEDLARKGTSVAIGASGVPVGDYTRKLLARLPAAQRMAIVDNVRTEEPDVAGIVAKLSHGVADAGFAYYTDVAATGGRLRAIELPAKLQPKVAYGAAVVKGAPNPSAARAFIAGLLRGRGADALHEAGFGPPPP